MNKLERQIFLKPAWDKRDANPAKNYGIHGMELVMYVIGEQGAIQLVVYTNMYLKNVEKELIGKCDKRYCSLKPMAADIGYHSKIAQYEGQEPSHDDCKLTKGVCYYDGSGLYAQTLFDEVFVPKGSDAMFEKMEEIYWERFGKEES